MATPRRVGEAVRRQHVVGPAAPGCVAHGQVLDAEPVDELDGSGVIGEARAEAGADGDRQHPVDAGAGACERLAGAGRFGVSGEADRKHRAAGERSRNAAPKVDAVDLVELVHALHARDPGVDVERPADGDRQSGHLRSRHVERSVGAGGERVEDEVGRLVGVGGQRGADLDPGVVRSSNRTAPVLIEVPPTSSTAIAWPIAARTYRAMQVSRTAIRADRSRRGVVRIRSVRHIAGKR